MIHRIYDSSDDEDDYLWENRDDFLIKEIRCCDCFFDKVINIKNELKEVTFYTLYQKMFIEYENKKLFRRDIYIFFSEVCVFCCEESKMVFEQSLEIDKDLMDERCRAELVDFHCLYFLSRETLFGSICESCQRTLLKIVSERLIKIIV